MSDAVTPFRIEVPEADLEDLRRRIAAARWPNEETVDDWSQGIPLAYVQEVAAYWAEKYDWRVREAALNRFDQFLTTIDGVDIHFLHVRSPHPDALPLVITHGWPGSVVEFHKVIEPLTEPGGPRGRCRGRVSRGLSLALPGYGFSGKPTEPGWGVEKIAERLE